MKDCLESAEAIGAVDDILANVGLTHGTRKTRTGAWKDGERIKRPRTSSAAPKRRKLGSPGVVSIPAMEALPWLRAGFSTRQGGVSTVYGDGELGQLNLGWTREDAPEIVAQNRRRFAQAVAAKSKFELATIRQFHSNMVRIIEKDHGPLRHGALEFGALGFEALELGAADFPAGPTASDVDDLLLRQARAFVGSYLKTRDLYP